MEGPLPVVADDAKSGAMEVYLNALGSVAALNSGSGGLDPINALRRAVGLDRLRIVPADIATGQKTAVAAGKYVTRKLFVEVITDGQGYSATRAEYQVTRWLSLLSSVSTIGPLVAPHVTSRPPRVSAPNVAFRQRSAPPALNRSGATARYPASASRSLCRRMSSVRPSSSCRP